MSLAAATLHSLAEAPGAGPPLAVLSSQVLVPSLLKLAGNGSDTGKQQVRVASLRSVGSIQREITDPDWTLLTINLRLAPISCRRLQV